MQEVCYCSRSGDVRDREPIMADDGREALKCPICGHLDYLEWLSEEAGFLLCGEARRRRELSEERRYFAA